MPGCSLAALVHPTREFQYSRGWSGYHCGRSGGVDNLPRGSHDCPEFSRLGLCRLHPELLRHLRVKPDFAIVPGAPGLPALALLFAVDVAFLFGVAVCLCLGVMVVMPKVAIVLGLACRHRNAKAECGRR
ncbi:MAG: hypothetical protein NC548_48680 [Lachnospiraceae bacterium]|nr:hypothetical protein [Lachnospiraceae bacterium]